MSRSFLLSKQKLNGSLPSRYTWKQKPSLSLATSASVVFINGSICVYYASITAFFMPTSSISA